jgi:hypothetical protein
MCSETGRKPVLRVLAAENGHLFIVKDRRQAHFVQKADFPILDFRFLIFDFGWGTLGPTLTPLAILDF